MPRYLVLSPARRFIEAASDAAALETLVDVPLAAPSHPHVTASELREHSATTSGRTCEHAVWRLEPAPNDSRMLLPVPVSAEARRRAPMAAIEDPANPR